MSAQKSRILVIDDDPISQRFICSSLENDYELEIAAEGSSGIDAATNWHPDIIILDVDMPGQTGFDVCRQLKSTEQCRAIPLIFVSGQSSLESRLKGFELGADDYLVKPCEREIIRARVAYLLTNYDEKRTLNDEVMRAQKAAKVAMSDNAELGRAIRFVANTYLLPNFDDLAKSVFQVMKELGLNTSLVFFSSAGELFYGANEQAVSPLERDVFAAVHDQDRFCDFGGRTICNYPHVALLVKNMPVNDNERYGRIKDTLPFILSATDDKVRALDTHMAILEQAGSLARSTDAIRATLASITENASSAQERITDIMRSLLQDFDEKLPKMGLEDDQEKYIVERIDSAFTQAIECLGEGEQLKQSLTGIIRLLTHLIAQQKKIIADQNLETARADSPQTDQDGDLELF